MTPPVPLPPALMAPDDQAEEWLESLADAAAQIAKDTDHPAREVGRDLKATPLFDLAERDHRPWRVTDLGSAEWAMSKCAQAEAELQLLGAQAALWSRRIQDWYAEAARPLEAKVGFMSAQLERYAIEVRAEDPKRKSVKLPSGTVKTTAKAARLVVTDEDAAKEWARENHPEAINVRTTETVLVGVLKERTRPVQYVTEATLTFSCGDVLELSEPDGVLLPAVGSEIHCWDCSETVLLGKVDVHATRWRLSVPVDGCDVDPGGVTAHVVLATHHHEPEELER